MVNGAIGSMTPEDPVPTRQLNGDPGEGLRDERSSPNSANSNGFRQSAVSGMGPLLVGRMEDEPGVLERLLGLGGAARDQVMEFVDPDPLSERGGIGTQASAFDPTRFTEGALTGDFRSFDPSRETGLRTDPFTGERGIPIRATGTETVITGPMGAGDADIRSTERLITEPVDPLLTEREEIAAQTIGLLGVPGLGRAFQAADRFVGIPAVAGAERGAAAVTRGARALPETVRGARASLDDVLRAGGRADRGQLDLVPSGRGAGRPGLREELSGALRAMERRAQLIRASRQQASQRASQFRSGAIENPMRTRAGGSFKGTRLEAQLQRNLRAAELRRANAGLLNRGTVPGVPVRGVAADFLGQVDIPTLSLSQPSTARGFDPGMMDVASGTGVTGIQATAPGSLVNRPAASLQVPGIEQMFVPGSRAIQSGREFIRQPTGVFERGGIAQRQPGLTANIPGFQTPGLVPTARVPPRPTRGPPRTPRIPGPVPGIPPIGFGGSDVFGRRNRRRFPFGFVNVQSPAFPGTNIRILPSGEVIQLPDPGQANTMQPRDPVTGRFVEA